MEVYTKCLMCRTEFFIERYDPAERRRNILTRNRRIRRELRSPR